jgi:hypothetical protein
MTNRSSVTYLVTVALLTAAALVASTGAAAAADYQGKYQDLLKSRGAGGAVQPLIAGQLGPGHVQDMDLRWAADRLVFAYVRQPYWGNVRNSWGSVSWRNGRKVVVFDHVVGFRDEVFWENGSEPTHLYEINLDGTGLRQLTDDKLYCDREPAYLPNGDVVFSSDRGCGASQCGAAPLAYSDFGLPNLFRVSADAQPY